MTEIAALIAAVGVAGISIPVLGVGLASQYLGLIPAGEAFTAIIGAPRARRCRTHRPAAGSPAEGVPPCIT